MKEQIITYKKWHWKNNRPDLLSEHDVLSAALQKIGCDERLGVVIRHENNRVFLFLFFIFGPFCLQL